MILDFLQARHVSSINSFQKEAAWTQRITRAVQIAQGQSRTHILLVFTPQECQESRNVVEDYLFRRFLVMAEGFAELGYHVQIAPITYGYSFLLSWGHHERPAK